MCATTQEAASEANDRPSTSDWIFGLAFSTGAYLNLLTSGCQVWLLDLASRYLYVGRGYRTRSKSNR